MELRVFLRLILGRGQFVNDAIFGIGIGVGIGVLFKLFGPVAQAASHWMSPASLSYFEWAFLGIFLTFLTKALLRVRRIADFKREALDVMEELIERGQLGPAQRKQLYHSLALRVSKEISLTGEPPTGDALRKIIEEETRANSGVEE